MFRRTTVHLILILVLIGMGQAISAGAVDEVSAEPSLQDILKQLLVQKDQHASDSSFHVRLADVYLDLGDDPAGEQSARKAFYDEGAQAAKQAIDLQEQNADAHYLYAANLGSGAQLTGLMASAFTVKELKQHVDRALLLNPNHAAALHMKGMMLEELPWVLGGDADGALAHLKRAVAVKPDYVHARLDLAKVYLKRKDQAAAQKELDAILSRPLNPTASAGERRHREEAQRLLNTLKKP
ncbi:MAG: tetratricopeptide repeat protein [Nitrospira sp.]|nr:tetratricopeptide repeat protein [Nitrospira sp.]